MHASKHELLVVCGDLPPQKHFTFPEVDSNGILDSKFC